MRLPVLKILWGMFAFPGIHPAQTLRAVGVPLIGVIGTTLYWAGRRVEAIPSLSTWLLLGFNWLLFAWLAVRIHRVVLLGEHEDTLASQVKIVASFFVAIVFGEFLFSLLVALTSMRYLPASAPAPTPDQMVGLPMWATALQLVPLYLLARVSPMLPAIALGQGWRLAQSWQLSTGNGWRLFAVVCLLPWTFHEIVDIAYASMESPVAIAVLAVAKSLMTALAVMALSLAYRELTAVPAPPPTAPRA